MRCGENIYISVHKGSVSSACLVLNCVFSVRLMLVCVGGWCLVCSGTQVSVGGGGVLFK